MNSSTDEPKEKWAQALRNALFVSQEERRASERHGFVH